MSSASNSYASSAAKVSSGGNGTRAWCGSTPPVDVDTIAPRMRALRVAGVPYTDAEIAQENRVGSAFVGWIAGCALIWGSLFAIGNFLYASGDPKRLTMAWVLTAVTLVSGYVLLKVTQQLWADSSASQAREDAKRV